VDRDTRKADFIAALDAAIDTRSMLSHPFYQAWNEGRLEQSVLQEYAKQYYAQVRAFPTYVSAVHSNCDDLKLRQELVENLSTEECGSENHPELWLRFAEGLGVLREDVISAELLPETKESVAKLRSLTRSEDALEGLAALYAYESQIPEVAKTKREGLSAFYGIKDERSVSFFSVHEETDLWHSQVERDALAEACVDDPERAERVIAAAGQGAEALRCFLDGVERAYLTPCESR